MLPYNDFAANGNNPLNSVSQPKGALHCPFPRTTIPETQTQTGSGQPSSLATRLAANENTGFFLGLVKLQPGTFLLWRMRGHFHCGMTLRVLRD